MGWCSGTDLFDRIYDMFIPGIQGETNKRYFIKLLIEAFQNKDWDCEFDSRHIDDKDGMLLEILEEMYPEDCA